MVPVQVWSLITALLRWLCNLITIPALASSDNYSDYGLVGARGLKTTLSPDGWYCSYTYPASGDFELVVVASNHGYSSADFKHNIYNGGKITVK
ncbi:MAG: hypothetical protein ABI288_02470 [Ginsengibacter sp.]